MSRAKEFKGARGKLTGNRGKRGGDVHVTPRQKQILRLVAKGLTNRQIGMELEISSRTVEVHRFNMSRTMGARNVAQLLSAGIRHNLLPRSLNIK